MIFLFHLMSETSIK